MAENEKEAATRSLILRRPARVKTEQIQRPATTHDVHTFFEAAAKLYPNVDLENIGIRVVTLDEFKKGDITPAIIEDFAVDSNRWNYLVADVFPSAQTVYVVPAYVGSSNSRDRSISADSNTQEYIDVWDGTNATLVEKPVKWVIGRNCSPSEIMKLFDTVYRGILKSDQVRGSSARGLKIQVARYCEEWLYWTRNTSEVDFVRDFFYKIDHPSINIYPRDWVSLATQIVFNELTDCRNRRGPSTKLRSSERNCSPTSKGNLYMVLTRVLERVMERVSRSLLGRLRGSILTLRSTQVGHIELDAAIVI